MSALKQLLIDHTITQASIAKALDVSGTTINFIVNNGQWPKKNKEQLRQLFINFLLEKASLKMPFKTH